jgi:hypothetical protein
MDPYDAYRAYHTARGCGIMWGFLQRYAGWIVGIVIIVAIIGGITNFVKGEVTNLTAAAPINACTSDLYCTTTIGADHLQIGGNASRDDTSLASGVSLLSNGTAQFTINEWHSGKFTLNIDYDTSYWCQLGVLVNHQPAGTIVISSGSTSDVVSLVQGNNTIELDNLTGSNGCNIIDLQLTKQK